MKNGLRVRQPVDSCKTRLSLNQSLATLANPLLNVTHGSIDRNFPFVSNRLFLPFFWILIRARIAWERSKLPCLYSVAWVLSCGGFHQHSLHRLMAVSYAPSV